MNVFDWLKKQIITCRDGEPTLNEGDECYNNGLNFALEKIEEAEQLFCKEFSNVMPPILITETVKPDRLECEVPSDYFADITEVSVIDEWTEETKCFADAEQIRKQVIDEFAEKLKAQAENLETAIDVFGGSNGQVICETVDEIAEQLKNSDNKIQTNEQRISM